MAARARCTSRIRASRALESVPPAEPERAKSVVNEGDLPLATGNQDLLRVANGPCGLEDQMTARVRRPCRKWARRRCLGQSRNRPSSRLENARRACERRQALGVRSSLLFVAGYHPDRSRAGMPRSRGKGVCETSRRSHMPTQCRRRVSNADSFGRQDRIVSSNRHRLRLPALDGEPKPHAGNAGREELVVAEVVKGLARRPDPLCAC